MLRRIGVCVAVLVIAIAAWAYWGGEQIDPIIGKPVAPVLVPSPSD